MALVGIASPQVEAAAVAATRPTRPQKQVKTKSKRTAAEKPKAVGAAGLLAIAQHDLDANNLEDSIRNAHQAAAKAPILEDYAQFIRAQAEYRRHRFDEVAHAVTRVFEHAPLSPITGPAAAIAVRAELSNGKPKTALELVQKFYKRIPQPEADLLLARSMEAADDLPQAASYYQRVYYNYPGASEADDAEAALKILKDRLGAAYPPPMPTAMLGRAAKMIDARKFPAARAELAAAIPQLGGGQRDLAKVKLGEIDLYDHKEKAAFDYLIGLKVDSADADAERLSFLIRSARKLDKHADVRPYLDQLEAKYPASSWRLEALVSIADQAGIDNDLSTSIPLYQACLTAFPESTRAPWCHWRITFASYRIDAPDTYDLLREQVQKYTSWPDTNGALYYLGRLMERRGEMGASRAYLDRVIEQFPNTFYAVISRDHIKIPQLVSATPMPAVTSFLDSLNWGQRSEFPSFIPNKMTQRRLDRAQLLATANLQDWAERELKFGAKNDGGQDNVYAYELAKLASLAGAPDRSIRFVKAYAPGYLYLPLDQAPVYFWKAAFPIPYRYQLEQYCKEQGLDPFLVAALIRQESEFNVSVVSHANAYGLMQVLPSTGKDLARRLKIKRFSSSQLLTADRNLQLGTYYFRMLLDQFSGQFEPALASYNAGKRRADQWRTWGPFREPAEFIEIVPFHETRGYIQVVLRNADIYRRLYAGTKADVPEYLPPAKSRKAKVPGVKSSRSKSKSANRPKAKPRRSTSR